MIQVALLMGPLVLGLVILTLEPTAGSSAEGFESLQLIAALLAPCSLPVAYLVRARMRRNAKSMQALPASQQAVALQLPQAAILEGAILFNLVVWLATNQPWPNAAAALIPAAALVSFIVQPVLPAADGTP